MKIETPFPRVARRGTASARRSTRGYIPPPLRGLLLCTCGAWIGTLVTISSIAQADPPKPPRISLAGTFNNWNTSDPDYTLKSVGDKFELVRSWPCGTSEFKFVFDGSWSKHLGDAGNGKLTQPGGDIKLVIPQSGTYAVWLDAKAGKWGFEKRAPAKPIARFIVQGANLYSDKVILDGRLSEVPKGRSIQSFQWRVGLKKDDPNPVDLHDGSAGGPGVTWAMTPYWVTLTIDDGTEKASTTTYVENTDNSYRATLHDAKTRKFLSESHTLPISDNVQAVYFDASPSSDGQTCSFFIGRDRGSRSRHVATLNLPNLSIPFLCCLQSDDKSPYLLTTGFHRFEFDPEANNLPPGLIPERVDLIGDFNGWTIGTTPLLSLPKKDRRFERTLTLPDGVYHYKFVINGVHFVVDPNADPKLTDKDGTSGVRIGPDPDKLGPVKPNDIVGAALFHDPSSNAWFAPIASDAATVTIRTLADDAQAVAMHIERAVADVPLRRVERRDGFDYWRGQVVAGPGPWTYSFDVTDGTATVRLAPKANADEDATTKPAFQGNLNMTFKTPDWAKTAVWYQIFPERFRNGDTSNDPPGTVPWKHAWYKPYKGPSTGDGTINEKGNFFGYIYDRRYGGDLQGVRDKLPYLRELGVTAIYFNPIFLAESLHKYDASDYRHIDDFFGVKDSLKEIKGETDDPKTWQWSETDKLFLDFLQEAHRQGFKVVLDGVFNHVGRDFWAFRDVMKNGEKSPYAGWFDIVSFKPFHYKAWDKPDGSLPRLRHDEALGLATPVREHLFAVTRRWMDPNGDGNPSDGIDGWRLDVAGDINVNFWRDWRALVKKTNPDAYIVAELWQESRVWLDGQSFDAVMNYPFAVRSQRFFVNNKKASKPSQFLKEIHEILGWYAPHVNHCLQNLYDSHDTDRLASMFLNPDLEYDQTNRPQDNGPNYNTGRPTAENYHRMKLAVTWQMMFLGSPMIYYGNEVGMFGADDPTDRKPMLWPDLLPYNDADERIEADVFEHHQRMIAIRNTYRALRLGSFESVYDDDKRGIVAFVRRLGGEAVLVVINNSDKARRVRLPTPWDGKGEVYRVDDPSVAEIKAAAGPQDRATIAIKPEAKSPQTIEKGVLKGINLAPRTAGVYVLVESK